jgi:hypothetical protein
MGSHRLSWRRLALLCGLNDAKWMLHARVTMQHSCICITWRDSQQSLVAFVDREGAVAGAGTVSKASIYAAGRDELGCGHRKGRTSVDIVNLTVLMWE